MTKFSIQLTKNKYIKLFEVTLTTTVLTIIQNLCTQEICTTWTVLFNLLLSTIMCLNLCIIKTNFCKSLLYLVSVILFKLFKLKPKAITLKIITLFGL